MSDRILTAVGLMAGTSLDGVDAAILRTDGDAVLEVGPSLSLPYEGPTRATIIRAIKAALEGRDEAKDITDAANMVTDAHLTAIDRLMRQAQLKKDEVNVIGFHGQTILHRPPIDSSAVGRTWQIGAGATIAYELGIDVVDQFRLKDMAHGGEGAPFAPVYHAALVRQEELNAPVCVINLGGVANITYIPADGQLTGMVAFDCGPGNGLVDQWVHQHTGEEMDEGGKLALSGQVDEEAVALMALNPYIRRKPPKSLDRYDFKLGHVEKLSLQDGAATLTAFTATCIAKSVALLPETPAEWIVCGGGRHNPAMMAALQFRLEAPVLTAEEKGWEGDMIEAQCFAYLAVRSLKGLPISFPGTTRVPHPMTGGEYNRKPV